MLSEYLEFVNDPSALLMDICRSLFGRGGGGLSCTYPLREAVIFSGGTK